MELGEQKTRYASYRHWLFHNDVCFDLQGLELLIPHLPIDVVDFCAISSRVSLDWLEQHIELPWDFGIVSIRSDLTDKFVLKNLKWDWDWDAISRNESISWLMVKQHRELPWNFDILSSRSHLDFELIRTNMDCGWTFSAMSDKIPIAWVLDHIDLGWDWQTVQMNPEFCPKVYEKLVQIKLCSL